MKRALTLAIVLFCAYHFWIAYQRWVLTPDFVRSAIAPEAADFSYRCDFKLSGSTCELVDTKGGELTAMRVTSGAGLSLDRDVNHLRWLPLAQLAEKISGPVKFTHLEVWGPQQIVIDGTREGTGPFRAEFKLRAYSWVLDSLTSR